jgi:hypothetical protein
MESYNIIHENAVHSTNYLNMLIYRNNKKRCMKKLFVVLAILFIGILIAGCTSQPPAPVVTPTPTPVPTPVYYPCSSSTGSKTEWNPEQRRSVYGVCPH